MQHLIDIIQYSIGKNKVEQLASIAAEQTYSVRGLIDLSFHKDAQIGFRAAWILENIYTNYQNYFLPATSYFLDNFSNQQNLSALRHFVKIFALMTKTNAPTEVKNVLACYNTNNLVEVVFTWLIDEKIPVAVKSHCLNILANLIPKHSWIKEELIETMDYLVDKESIAFFAKVKQVRKQLKIIR